MKYLYKGSPVKLEPGTVYADFAEKVAADYPAPVILAKVGQRLIELNKTVPEESVFLKEEPKELSFITTADRDGKKTYERGATMMFLRAAARVLGKRISYLKLEYALGDGLFFTLRLAPGNGEIDDASLEEIKSVMRRYAEKKEPFEKFKIRTDEAKAIFARHGMTDKERLFHYRRTSTTNIYKFGNYFDYYYGYMPPDASYVKLFDLKKLPGGVQLELPHRSSPGVLRGVPVPLKLFATMKDTELWGENIGISTVADLNDAITEGRGRDIILASEAYQEHRIGEIARRIKEENRRIVMIAGPSSSGKTSFSHRLAVQLGNVGIKARPIALDNYYVAREKTPLDENGEYDFECLEALDVELFNRNMTDLLAGKAVTLPVFDFKAGAPGFADASTSISEGEVLVIEGIHGLNDRMSYAIDPKDKFRIYISAVTSLNIDEHNRIPTTDNREIRRMVRDARTRGFCAVETISRWQSVRHGEEKHIFPFQEDADVMFNSASLYELAVLKTFAEPLLFSVPEDSPEYVEAKRLLKFLEYFLGLSCEDVPRNSLIREFIGGSIFPVG